MNYSLIYQKIISNANTEYRLRHKGIYYENHHIIPRCMGGGDEKDNLVLLTAKEHFIVHKLLTYIYPNNRKIVHAFSLMVYMNKRKYKISSREYSYVRKLYNESPMLESTKEKMRNSKIGKKNPMFGKPGTRLGVIVTNDTKTKMRNNNKGVGNPCYGKTKEKHWIYGKTHTNEVKEKIKEKMKLSMVICEYCNKNCHKHIYTRWHGEKCKFKI